MSEEHRSFPERTYKADVTPEGLSYKIHPMDMIIEQIKEDSKAAGVEPDNSKHDKEIDSDNIKGDKSDDR